MNDAHESTKYRKTGTVEAIRWTGDNLFDVITFTDGKPDLTDREMQERWGGYCSLVDREGFRVKSAEGYIDTPIGHWVLKGSNGDVWPCSDEYFQSNYEQARLRRKAGPTYEAIADAISWLEAMSTGEPTVAGVRHVLSLLQPTEGENKDDIQHAASLVRDSIATLAYRGHTPPPELTVAADILGGNQPTEAEEPADDGTVLVRVMVGSYAWAKAMQQNGHRIERRVSGGDWTEQAMTRLGIPGHVDMVVEYRVKPETIYRPKPDAEGGE